MSNNNEGFDVDAWLDENLDNECDVCTDFENGARMMAKYLQAQVEKHAKEIEETEKKHRLDIIDRNIEIKSLRVKMKTLTTCECFIVGKKPYCRGCKNKKFIEVMK